MKINFRNLGYAAAAVLTGLYAFSGCNESTILGKDLIPGADKVTVLDTTINSLITHNIAVADSSVVTGADVYTGALGSITDDIIFGKSHGFLYTQIGLPEEKFTFAGTGQVLDSVVLYIGADTTWFGENQPLNLKVYEMNEPNFKIDSYYTYTRPLSYDQSKMVGSISTYPVYPKDSINIYGEKRPPSLRIPLSAAFGNNLLQQRADQAFLNDSAFKVYLNGLAIVPDTMSSKTMLFPILNNGETRVVVYYKNSENDSLKAEFPFKSTSSGHGNYFVRNYTNAEVANYINTGKPEGDSMIYLQDAPGIYTQVQIPGLENFPKSVINQAELVLTEISSGFGGKDQLFDEPDRLMLYRYITHDSLGYMLDYGNPSQPNLAYFGGNKTVISDVGGIKIVQYKFNIARHLQFIIDKKMDNSVLKLMSVSNRYAIDMKRVKAGGGNATPPANIKLRIIYTQL
ncbi:DUF4270 family protein [Chitinophaga alhagiae]|uniref:DUF4270 family protein n=1 Tax=Chitinophaga alhagiae TaxID=2203219 RepID=UPI00130096A3|nr:DUF4270 family protein [Chitinophaga alhagiae]